MVYQLFLNGCPTREKKPGVSRNSIPSHEIDSNVSTIVGELDANIDG